MAKDKSKSNDYTNGNNVNERWTTIALKSYVDSRLDDIATSTLTAKEAADSAIERANKTAEDFRAQANEWRGAMSDREGKFAVHSDIDSINTKIDELRSTPWSTYYSFGMILLIMVGGFWGLAYSPILSRFDHLEQTTTAISTLHREDMNKIQSELLQRRQEFVQAVEFKAFEKRLDDLNVQQNGRINEMLTLPSFSSWKNERDKLIEQIIARIDKLYNIIEHQNQMIADIKGKQSGK